MHLVIPIEDTSSGNDKDYHCISRQEDGLEAEKRAATASDAVERTESKQASLSAELRDQFETMKSIWREARRGDGGQANLKRKERQAAVETAIKVENEMTAWENGIADLEALLAAEEEEDDEFEERRDREQGENGPPGIREIAFVRWNNNAPRQRPPQFQFPTLPPAIPTEDEKTEEEDLVTMSTAASSRV